MNIEEIREYCLSKPGATESLPINDTALVFKVGKMFAVLDLSEESRGITLKCDSELAIELRERYSEVTPAWHFHTDIVSYSSLKSWVFRYLHGFKSVFSE
jgi:predicted DNA-binding protein (MmcQ/YjbR family)